MERITAQISHRLQQRGSLAEQLLFHTLCSCSMGLNECPQRKPTLVPCIAGKKELLHQNGFCVNYFEIPCIINVYTPYNSRSNYFITTDFDQYYRSLPNATHQKYLHGTQ